MRRHHRRIQENTREYFYIRNIGAYGSKVVVQEQNVNVYNGTLYYSVGNMSSWNAIQDLTAYNKINIDPNQKVYFKGNGDSCSRVLSKVMYQLLIYLENDDKFEVGGYLSSLFQGDNFKTNNVLVNGGISAHYCENMFGGTKVVRANKLIFPENTFGFCYRAMFGNCAELDEAPVILPATTLARECYSNMFRDCPNIIEAPVLPAKHLALRCYERMFESCTNLRYIECHSLDDMTTSYCANWLTGTSGEGVFIKDANATWNSQDASYGVPVGWTIFKGDPYECPFYIEDRSGSAQTVWFTRTGNTDVTYESSYDQSSWSTQTGPSVNLLPYGKTYIRLKTGTQGTFPYRFSSSDENFAIGGSLLSLLTRDFATVKHDYAGMSDNAFREVFSNCVKLVSAIGLHFINKVSTYCYCEMFNKSALIYPPHKLPAETLVNGCYRGMFKSCGSLVAIPKLPAKTVPTHSYTEMFADCDSLTRAKIYAETIDGDSLIGMFADCNHLEWIDAPILSADSSHTSGFTYGVSGSGTFIKNAEATWSTTGDSGVPNGWTTVMRYV